MTTQPRLHPGKAWLGRRPLIAGAAALAAVPARAQSSRKMVLGIGTQVINLTYPTANLPLALGWFAQDGIDASVVPIAGGLQAIQLLQAGSLQFAMMNSGTIIQANVVNGVPVRAIMQTGVVDWALVTLDSSPITDPHQFKGTTIGVLSLATGGIAFLNSYMRGIGLDPDRDFRLVALGAGAAALEALRSGRVQGLMYWGSMLATFENIGAKLRYFRDPDWRSYPDFCLVALQTLIDREPQLVETVGRDSAKAMLFSLTNPDCVRQVQWSHWPGTKPTGAPNDAEMARWDLNSLRAQNDAMREAKDANGGTLWGRVTADGMSRMQDLLFDTKTIDRKLPADTYVIRTPGFFEKINDFDHAQIEALATSCHV